MTMPDPAATPLFDTPTLLARFARVREDLALSPADVRMIFGASEEELRAELRAGRTLLPRRVEKSIRLMDEVAARA